MEVGWNGEMGPLFRGKIQVLPVPLSVLFTVLYICMNTHQEKLYILNGLEISRNKSTLQRLLYPFKRRCRFCPHPIVLKFAASQDFNNFTLTYLINSMLKVRGVYTINHKYSHIYVNINLKFTIYIYIYPPASGSSRELGLDPSHSSTLVQI